jgi:hypothetical protein
MEMQMDWVNIIKPNKSLLKFALPYEHQKYVKSFAGKIYFQTYFPISTEARLVPDDSLHVIDYDPVKFDEQMHYFNQKTRIQKYSRYASILKEIGLANNYDTTLELYILGKYLKKFGVYNRENLIDLHFRISVFFIKIHMSSVLKYENNNMLNKYLEKYKDSDWAIRYYRP